MVGTSKVFVPTIPEAEAGGSGSWITGVQYISVTFSLMQKKHARHHLKSAAVWGFHLPFLGSSLAARVRKPIALGSRHNE
jgi:hypothetical protein